MHISRAHSKARTACVRSLKRYLSVVTILTALLLAKMTCLFRTWRRVNNKEIQDKNKSDQCSKMHQANHTLTRIGIKVGTTYRSLRFRTLTSEQGFISRLKANDSSTLCPDRINPLISVKSSQTQVSFYLISSPCKSSYIQAKRQRSLTDLKALKECLRMNKWVQCTWQPHLCIRMMMAQSFSLSLCNNCPLQVDRKTNICLTQCRQLSKPAPCH